MAATIPKEATMDLAAVFESDKGFRVLEEDFTAALKERRFGILTRVDVRQAMAERGVDFESDIILLGICSPTHAKEVLAVEEDVALMLPCPAAIYARERGSTLKVARPGSIVSFFSAPGLEPIAARVEEEVLAAARAAAA